MESYSYCNPSIKSEMVKFVDGIIHGNYELETHFIESMSINLVKAKVVDKLKEAKTNLERLTIVEACFPLEDFRLTIPLLDNVFLKTKTIVRLIEDRVDKFYSSKYFEEALKCCHLALMFSPESESIKTRIYMRRTTVLIALGEFRSALTDIDILLSKNISPKQKGKLIEQKKQAETSIVLKKTTKDIAQRKIFFEEKMGKVFGQKSNSETLPMADCISVEWNQQKERHLVTKDDLEPGTTVIVESAYVKVVTDHLTWQTKYCNTCLKKILCATACKTCVFVIYCCEGCRLEDWNEYGHKYECPLLPYMHAVKISQHMHLSLKTVCKAGPEYLWNSYIKSKSDQEESTTPNLNRHELIPPANIYNHIASFKCHIRSSGLHFTVWLAISLSKLLFFKTTFFNNIEASQRSELERFVGTMLIQHAEAFRYNTVAICADVEIKNVEIYYTHTSGERDINIASGIFPFISMMAHSCAPTTFRQSLLNGQLAIITNQKLKAGNEISLSYGLLFMKDNILDRKSYLLQYYHFECTCVACVEKWPIYKDVLITPTFLCPICNDKDQIISKNLPFLQELKKNFGKCSNCKDMFKLNLLKIEAKKYQHIVETANRHLMDNQPLEAMPLFVDCIKYYQKKICKPSIQFAFAQSRLGDCFDFIINKNTNPEIRAYERYRRGRYCNII